MCTARSDRWHRAYEGGSFYPDDRISGIKELLDTMETLRHEAAWPETYRRYSTRAIHTGHRLAIYMALIQLNVFGGFLIETKVGG